MRKQISLFVVARGGGVGSVDSRGHSLDILLASLVVQIFDSPFLIWISRTSREGIVSQSVNQRQYTVPRGMAGGS